MSILPSFSKYFIDPSTIDKSICDIVTVLYGVDSLPMEVTASPAAVAIG